MSNTTSTLRIGVFGSNPAPSRKAKHGSGLWPAGYDAAITFAGGTPVSLGETLTDDFWDEVQHDLHGLVLVNSENQASRRTADAERLCEWAQEHRIPLLAIDQGLLIMNSTFGGNCFNDLAREKPEALQHRHPPEKGLRHALAIIPNTRMCDIYGEGEVVVNSEHRRGVNRVARGFRVGAQALDGVVEAIEAVSEAWFAIGVQWQPASTTASGLDIQLFRALLDAAKMRIEEKAAPREFKVAA